MVRSFGELLFAGLVIVGAFACGKENKGGGDDEVDAAVDAAPCGDSLGCFIVDCAAKDLPPTSISGTVYAPNGTLPLYGVNVYVPVSDPGPLPEGAQCDKCSSGLLGGAYASTTTDEAGQFVLNNVPATDNIPVVVQSGKWRRQFTIPTVAACQDLPIPVAQTRLPKNKSEGDIPKIAITTGNADALECLPRKLGIDDSEFTTNGGDGRVHLFYGNGARRFAPTHPTGALDFPAAATLWATTDELRKYDMTFLSCEGGQNPGNKPQSSIDAMVDYANLGGRVFASHWHNIWLAGNQNANQAPRNDEWASLATYNFGAGQADTTQLAVIDETVPKGPSFAKWLDNVGASTVHAQIPVSEPRYIIQDIDSTRAERWVYIDPALSTPTGRTGTQDFLFETPVGEVPANRCGKVVFGDMHVSSGSRSRENTPFPNDCSTADLTPQEKALAFIFFDIATCVGVIN